MKEMSSKNMFLSTVAIVSIMAVACINMGLILRGGMLFDQDVSVRIAYIHDNLTLWRLAWLSWNLAAMGLLFFGCMLLRFIPNSRLRLYGIILIAIGIGPDVSAEMIFAFIIPPISKVNPNYDVIRAFELLAVQLTGFVGNGFYNIGGLLLNILLLQNPKLPRKLILAGIPGWWFGIGISAGAALLRFDLLEPLTGIAMFWSTFWIMAMGWFVFRHAERYEVDPSGEDAL
jgi:hypothetical protein